MVLGWARQKAQVLRRKVVAYRERRYAMRAAVHKNESEKHMIRFSWLVLFSGFLYIPINLHWYGPRVEELVQDRLDGKRYAVRDGLLRRPSD